MSQSGNLNVQQQQKSNPNCKDDQINQKRLIYNNILQHSHQIHSNPQINNQIQLQKWQVLLKPKQQNNTWYQQTLLKYQKLSIKYQSLSKKCESLQKENTQLIKQKQIVHQKYLKQKSAIQNLCIRNFSSNKQCFLNIQVYYLRMVQAQKQNKNYNQQITKLKNQNQKLNQKIKEMKKEHEQLSKNNQQNKILISKYQIRIKYNYQQYKQRYKRMLQKYNQLFQHNQQIRVKIKEKQQLKKQLKQKSDQCRQITNKNKALQTQLIGLKQKCVKLEHLEHLLKNFQNSSSILSLLNLQNKTLYLQSDSISKTIFSYEHSRSKLLQIHQVLNQNYNNDKIRFSQNNVMFNYQLNQNNSQQISYIITNNQNQNSIPLTQQQKILKESNIQKQNQKNTLKQEQVIQTCRNTSNQEQIIQPNISRQVQIIQPNRSQNFKKLLSDFVQRQQYGNTGRIIFFDKQKGMIRIRN